MGTYTARAMNEAFTEALRELLHRTPRNFGKEATFWTLAVAAEVSFEQGITDRRVSDEPIRATLARVGRLWERAKRWMEPRSRIRPKKGIGWSGSPGAVRRGFWASRTRAGFLLFERPSLRSRAEAREPVRLLRKEPSKDDPEPRALSCYGLYLPELEESWLRFVDGRPLSAITTRLLQWGCRRLEARGKKALLLIWDNASWHKSREVRGWVAAHNRRVKAGGGREVRMVACPLPIKSPRLNAIEPKWIHSERKVTEPERLLGAYELADRVCGVFGCPHYEHLSIPQEVA